MPDPVKSLLAKWKIDGSSWQTAVASYRSQLKQADTEDQQRAARQKTAQAQSLAAVQIELASRKSLSSMSASEAANYTKKIEAIKSVQAAAASSAADQLAATKRQIAAEQLKAAQIKSALMEQKQAATNAIVFEKAYNAQLQEVAKAKAKAAAIFDDAYRAQVSEVQRNKKLDVQPRTPAAQYSSIPIVTPNEKRQTLNPENDKRNAEETTVSTAQAVQGYEETAEAAKLAGQAGQDAATRIIEGNESAIVSNAELTASYQRVLSAQENLAKADRLVTFRQSAVDKDIYSGTHEEAKGKLDDSLAIQAAAQKELSEAQQQAAALGINATEKQVVSNEALVRSYDAVLAAQLKVTKANASVTFRKSVLDTKAYSGVTTKKDEEKKLSDAINVQAQAKADLAAAQLDYENKIAAIQNVQIRNNEKLIGQAAAKAVPPVVRAAEVEAPKPLEQVISQRIEAPKEQAPTVQAPILEVAEKPAPIVKEQVVAQTPTPVVKEQAAILEVPEPAETKEKVASKIVAPVAQEQVKEQAPIPEVTAPVKVKEQVTAETPAPIVKEPVQVSQAPKVLPPVEVKEQVVQSPVVPKQVVTQEPIIKAPVVKAPVQEQVVVPPVVKEVVSPEVPVVKAPVVQAPIIEPPIVQAPVVPKAPLPAVQVQEVKEVQAPVTSSPLIEQVPQVVKVQAPVAVAAAPDVQQPVADSVDTSASVEAFNAEAEAASATGKAAQDAASAATAANEKVVTAADQARAAYQRLAEAQLEVIRTSANVKETFAAITSGSYKGTDAQGTARLAADMQAQAAAQLNAKKAASDEDLNAVARASAARRTEIQENLQLIAQEKARAQAAKLTAEQELANSLRREAANKAAYNQSSGMYKFFNDYKPETNYIRHVGGEGEGESSSRGFNSTKGGLAQGGIGIGRQEKDTVDFIMGRNTIGPIDAIISKVKGLPQLISAAFPILGGVMFGQMLIEMGKNLYELSKQLQQFPDTLRTAFEAQNLEIGKSNDELRKSTDLVNNAVARLEHKPQNNLAIALDDSRIAADDLAAAANRANENIKKILTDNNVSGLKAFFIALQNAVPGVTPGSTDRTTKTFSTIDELSRAQQQASNIYDQSRQLESPLEQARLAGIAKGATPTQIAAGKEAERKQNELKTKASTSNNELTRFLEKENTDRNTYSKTETNEGDTIPITKAEYDRLKSMSEMHRRLREGIAGVYTPEETAARNANTLAAVGPLLQRQYKTTTTEREKQSQEEAQKREKDKEQAMQDARDSLQQATAHYNALKELAAAALEAQKLDIEKLADANEDAYKRGNITAQEYYAQKTALSKRTLQDTLADIAKERQADLAVLKKRAATEPTMSVGSRGYKDEQTRINKQYDIKSGQATYVATREESQNDTAAYEANLKVALDSIQISLDARLKALDLETEAVKHAFQEQQMSGAAYVSASKQQIQDRLNATLNSINAEESLYGVNDPRRKELGKKRTDAVGQAIRETNTVDDNAVQTELQGVDAVYSSRNRVLTEKENLANAPGQQQDINVSRSINTEQLTLAKAQLGDLNSLLEKAAQTSGVYSKDWLDVYTNILSVNTQVANLLDKQKTLASNMPSIANVFGAGAQAASSIFGGRYARGLEGALGTAAGVASNATKTTQGIFSGKDESGKETNPWVSYKSITQDNDGMSEQVPTGKIDVGATIDDFAKHLTSAIGAVGQFATSIANAGSASAGGLAGGLSGAGLGNSVGQQLGQEGGPLESMGAMAGPFGALIGGAAGAAMGAIMGQKQEEVQSMVNQLEASFKSIMNSYSSNNSSLAATVKNLQSLVLQAQADEAQTKKGGSQFKDLIKQYNEQITQLEDQQKQIMAQMQQQLIQISSPEAYQPLISSIQDVLKQYTQYVGAAQSATELADANNYLTQSLQNLGQSYSEQLQQNQENAIQDALNLNQLYNQRNQLEYQYLQQVRSIQGQGTLTRGVTLAQSKYSQLYNLDVNQANALDAINQQINVEQYKVTAESKIFQMAQTKAGLEQQSLLLQEQGINLDMKRIVAMQNVLTDLEQTGYSIVGNLGTLDTSNPNALMTLLLQILASQLGVSATSAGSTSLATAAAQSYAGNMSYGYGTTKGYNL